MTIDDLFVEKPANTSPAPAPAASEIGDAAALADNPPIGPEQAQVTSGNAASLAEKSPAGSAWTEAKIVNPESKIQNGLALPLLTIDPYANSVYEVNIGGGIALLADEPDVTGPEDNNVYSLGFLRQDGGNYIVVDMGPGQEAVCDRPGPDLRVYERLPREGFSVWGSNTPGELKSWVRFDRCRAPDCLETGNNYYYNTPPNLEPSAAFRYVKIKSETSQVILQDAAGPDIDAIEALNMCAPTPGQPQITSPANNSVTGASSISFSGTADALVSIELARGETVLQTISSNINGDWATSTNIGLNPGKNTFRVTARMGTRSSPPAFVTVYRDTQAPQTTIAYPPANQWLAGTHHFTGTTTDDNAGLRLEYNVNYTSTWVFLDNSPAAAVAWGVEMPTADLTSGENYVFSFRAWDVANQPGVVTRTFRVDNQPPTAVISTTSPQFTTTFTLTWSGDDAGHSGVAGYEVRVSANNSVSTTLYTGLATSQVFSTTYGGDYTFYVQATDQVGNPSAWVSKTIRIDLTTPSILQPAPTGFTNNATPTLSGDFSGSGGPVNTNSLVVKIDGQTRSETPNVTTSALTEGLHTVEATITNPAGSGGGAWNFTVDSQVPTVTLTAGPVGPTSLRVAWASSDPAPSSGIRGYDVQYRPGAGGSWTPWLTNTTQSHATFQATLAQSYTFQIRALDNANNASAWVQTGVVELSPVTKYYLFGGQAVAMRRGNVVYYLSGDHLGSTSLTTDQSGAVIAETRYLPYGEERWTDGAQPTDFGFTSQRNEAGFGLMDYNARYYSPVLGRFVSPDTVVPDVENPQAWNRYSYVYGNPKTYS